MISNLMTKERVVITIITSETKIDRISQLSIGTLSTTGSQMGVSFQSTKKSICSIKTISSRTTPHLMPTRSTSSVSAKKRRKTTKATWSCSKKKIPTRTLGTSLSRAASNGSTRASPWVPSSNLRRSLAIASTRSAASSLKLAIATTPLPPEEERQPVIRRPQRRRRITRASVTPSCRR